jgi:sugar lactone lactonase YvrE
MARSPMLVLGALSALLVAVTAAAAPYPDVIALPPGFQPEGIAVGNGHTFYVGSIPTGRIYRGDLRTGQGSVLVQPESGRAAIGVEVDNRNRIFVAGGGTGQGYVYDARTGASLAEYDFAPPGPTTFVNDLVVTKDAAWFTDSRADVLYRVPLARNGALANPADVEALRVTGDFALVPNTNNLNGIEATPDGATLIAVQSNLGRLYTIDPATGEADLIELSGGDVQFGDGILLDGRTLYVVQNRLNRVAVVELAPDLGSGTIVGHLTHPAFDIPTTIAEHGDRLFAVNARFGTAGQQPAAYSVVQVRK